MGKYAIFIVSALIFSMLTYSSALRNALFQSNFRNIESFSQIQAYNIANSAALVAINDIRNNSGSNFAPEEGETYSYPSSTGFEVWEDLAGSYNLQATNQADTLLVIQSTGRFEETDYRVTVGLTTGTSDWIAASVDKAIHAENSMDLGNGYVEGDVSLNETFNAFGGNSNADVAGDLYFVDADMTQMEYEELNSDIVTNIYKEVDPFVHPNPIFPEYSVNSTNDYNTSNGTENWVNNGVSFNSFSANNTTINTGIEGDETKIYVNDLNLSKDLNLSGDGRVSIYVEENLDLGNGQVNSDGLPENLTIYYKGINNIKNDVDAAGSGSFRGLLFVGTSNVSVNIQGNYTFNGNIISFGNEVILGGTPDISSLIYAPNADVTIKGTGTDEFRGAIVSKAFYNDGGASIIYDEKFASTLPQLDQADDSKYVVLYWK